MNKPTRLTLIAFTISTLLGANNSIAVRFSNAELPPFSGAAIRFAAAALILFLLVAALRLPLPRGRALLGVAVFGALQFGFSYVLMYWSLLRVPAGLFQVVFSVVPLFTFLFAILHRQERFQWKVLVGGVMAVAGIAIIFRSQLTANVPVLSLLAIVLAAACIAESAVLFKTFPKSHPITTNAVAMAVGAAIHFSFAALFREAPQWPVRPSTWIAVLYLVFLGSTVTFLLVLYVLTRWTASATSYQLVLMPIVTVLSAAWIANETINAAFVAGGGLVLAGVYIGALAPVSFFQRSGVFGRKSPNLE